MFRRLFRWKEKIGALGQAAAQRFGYIPFKDTVLKRRVPKTPWYQGDGATLTTLLLIQVVTGVTMTLYYTNAAEHAYGSVRFITDRLTLGWLIRGIHYWTAGIMVTVMFIHVCRHLVEGGYKAPREGHLDRRRFPVLPGADHVFHRLRAALGRACGVRSAGGRSTCFTRCP
jgi:hypothetical protein